ncbi:hypothetical protein BACCIP111895_03701 [Neobacillus rhizosphaerae]|uniref:Short-chain dehydrogenase n=1 Tax=Neobacillus rhizosphaerae TaxID=2880965 RepID=A0ABN8KRN0_9BACI|nr:hypothetical protein [Neobacillus rhizosphaerae]CAH2716514.1 hypothetical protein BACCIP111895_03701 [Neobacillus rhizosphaerae]
MNLFVNILAIAIFGTLAVSLLYTLSVARQQKAVEGDIDTKMAKPVKENVYLRNPIFLAYIIFFALLLFIILFVAIIF